MKPLDNFQELEKWIPTDLNEKCLISYKGQIFQDISGRLINENSNSKRNKVLFCHDMKGGYLDDALTEKNENIFAYRFYFWHLIDIFVYFSHHLVTIPPKAWIHQCHKNGVQCLGTFIIEDQNMFKTLLELDNINMTSRKLTEIKEFYNFDGWLINLECYVENSKHLGLSINKIIKFLQQLVELGNEVYWYDAITISGTLVWQNGLTKQNKPFYDICGNIFTNYCWNKEHLTESMKMSDGNGHKVFVGIDCFGRGCPGGGGLKCNVALNMLEEVFEKYKYDNVSKFSVALFAPGWCHESINSKDLNKELDERTWKFFNLIEKYLQPQMNNVILYRQLPESISDNFSVGFQTTFDLNQGFYNFVDGIQQFDDEDHYNFLINQQLTPIGEIWNPCPDFDIKILPVRHLSYNGYSCMKIVAERTSTNRQMQVFSPLTITLFRLGCRVNVDGPKNLDDGNSNSNEICLELVLGSDIKDDQEMLWNASDLILHFDIDQEEIFSLPFLLNDIQTTSFVSCSKVNWNSFIIPSLYQTLNIKELQFTLRKIDLRFRCREVIEKLVHENIFLGFLKIAPKKCSAQIL